MGAITEESENLKQAHEQGDYRALKLADQTLLITGASGNLGRALARHFGPKCRAVILTGRRRDALEESAEKAASAGATVETHCTDLNDAAAVEALAQRVNRGGRMVDVLINNAADVTSKPLLETSLQEVEAILHTNVVSVLQLTKLLLPPMLAQERGTIVNVSSLAGYKANPAQTVYSVSKSALNSVSEALRAEVGGRGIHVLNVALSSVTVDEGAGHAVPFSHYARALERAIARGQEELFLSPVSKWLMRLYKFYPPLLRLGR